MRNVAEVAKASFARAVIATLLGVLWIIPSGRAASADFIQVLAERLGTKPDFLVLNLPPRPAAWPGAIFTYDLRIPIVRGSGDDPALSRGNKINIEGTSMVELGGASAAGWGALFSIAAKAAEVAEVTMSFPETRIVDLDYSELLKRIQQSPQALAAAKRGRVPLIVVKAYEGTPTLTLAKKSGVSAEAWAARKIPLAQAQISANVEGQDRITYQTTDRIVFAFETMKADFDIVDKGAATGPQVAWRLEPSPLPI